MRYSKLIDALYTCETHCNHCTDSCLESENIEAMVDCIRTNQVCAAICSATARILAVSFTDVGDLIKYCHRICMNCATECEKHDHEHCRQCAEACKKCAAACKEVLVKYEAKA